MHVTIFTTLSLVCILVQMRSLGGDKSAGYFVWLCVESMWHDLSRKGGEPFSLAGNKCASLSLGRQPERPSALQVELKKMRDVTFPKAAEVRWPISHPHLLYCTERERLTVRGFGFGWEVSWRDLVGVHLKWTHYGRLFSRASSTGSDEAPALQGALSIMWNYLKKGLAS